MAAWYQALHATKRYRLGTIKTDVTGKQYMYLKGVASTAIGDTVQFDPVTFATTRLTTSLGQGPVAVALAANTSATNFSWYQIYGLAAATSLTAVVVGLTAQATATAGQIDDTTTASKSIVGCTIASVGGVAATASVWLNYPFYEGIVIP